MCLNMKVIGKGESLFILGIVLGIIGIAGVSINYPLYTKVLTKRKQKYFLRFYFSGIIGIFEEWLHDGCKETIEKIDFLIQKLVNSNK